MFFFFNDTATTEIYTLSLHDALPIYDAAQRARVLDLLHARAAEAHLRAADRRPLEGEDDDRRNQQARSEEHTSELQSRQYLVCRLLLEKKKKKQIIYIVTLLLTAVIT